MKLESRGIIFSSVCLSKNTLASFKAALKTKPEFIT